MRIKIAVNWLIEFGPIILFFLAFEFFNFWKATFVLVAATIGSMSTAFLWDRRFAWLPFIASSLVVVFGIATLITRNPEFLVLEYTVYNGFFAVVLLGGIALRRGMLKFFLHSLFAITDRGWFVLSYRWGLLFLSLAVLNEVVWRAFSEHGWVIFRFVALLVMFTFAFLQGGLLKKERLPEATEWGLKRY